MIRLVEFIIESEVFLEDIISTSFLLENDGDMVELYNGCRINRKLIDTIGRYKGEKYRKSLILKRETTLLTNSYENYRDSVVSYAKMIEEVERKYLVLGDKILLAIDLYRNSPWVVDKLHDLAVLYKEAQTHLNRELENQGEIINSLMG